MFVMIAFQIIGQERMLLIVHDIKAGDEEKLQDFRGHYLKIQCSVLYNTFGLVMICGDLKHKLETEDEDWKRLVSTITATTKSEKRNESGNYKSESIQGGPEKKRNGILSTIRGCNNWYQRLR